MIAINEPFRCRRCGHENPKASVGYRNHCRECLYSLHVDDEVPGDRGSDCGGLMEPLSVTVHGRKGYEILHKCVKCGRAMPNKTAPDHNI